MASCAAIGKRRACRLATGTQLAKLPHKKTVPCGHRTSSGLAPPLADQRPEGARFGGVPGVSNYVGPRRPARDVAPREGPRHYFTIVKCSAKYEKYAIVAAAGMVSTHAQTMLVAMPQRTAFIRWMLPTPAMAPAMACVVETGVPI